MPHPQEEDDELERLKAQFGGSRRDRDVFDDDDDADANGGTMAPPTAPVLQERGAHLPGNRRLGVHRRG